MNLIKLSGIPEEDHAIQLQEGNIFQHTNGKCYVAVEERGIDNQCEGCAFFARPKLTNCTAIPDCFQSGKEKDLIYIEVL